MFLSIKVVGFFFVESAKILKSLTLGGANREHAIGHGLDWRDQDGVKQMFCGESG